MDLKFDKQEVILHLSLEEHKIIISCINITLEFLEKIPFKTNDIKIKIKEIKDLKSEID